MISGKNEGDGVWIDALQRALRGHGPEREGLLLFMEQRHDAAVELDDRHGRPRVDHSRTCGLSVRGPFAGGGMGHRADPRPADVERLVRAALGGPRPGPQAPSSQPGEWTSASPRLSTDRASRLLERLIDAAKKLHSAARVRGRWVGFEQRVWIGRPGHDVILDRRQCCRVRLDASRESRGGPTFATVEAVLRHENDADEGWFDRLARQVTARLESRVGAQALGAGERATVFAPGVGGVLAHELVGHALEADAMIAGASWVARGRGDRSVGPSGLTVLDDPRRSRAAWRFDDEGEPARPTPLLGEGRVVGWLHDLRSARRCGRAPTGHGRRSSFREPVRPRMGCTFVAPGSCLPEQALEGVAEGIYVRRMDAASTDTLSGHAVFKVTDADEIRKGRLGAPLKPHLMVVDARAALSSVECIANDLVFDTCVGSCLHHGQPLSISVGGPTFRIGMTSAVF